MVNKKFIIFVFSNTKKINNITWYHKKLQYHG